MGLEPTSKRYLNPGDAFSHEPSSSPKRPRSLSPAPSSSTSGRDGLGSTAPTPYYVSDDEGYNREHHATSYDASLWTSIPGLQSQPSSSLGCSLSCTPQSDSIHAGVDTLNTTHVAESVRQPLQDQTGVICFGMLYDLHAQICAVRDCKNLGFERIGSSTDTFASLDLVLNYERGDICTQNGTTVAILNRKAHLALLPLNTSDSVRFTALITPKILMDKVSIASSKGNKVGSVICSIDLLVYGPKNAGDAVARGLAKYHFFLQHPHPYTTTLDYCNPQYLTITGASFSVGTILPPLASEVITHTSLSLSRATRQEEQQLDPWKALDKLNAPEGLRRIEVDQKISTDLLDHQREGVDFIMRRENSELPQVSLWELIPGPDSREYLVYQHRITGARRPAPEEIQGGLLADDMGLGKTLMMIVTIVATMSLASKHASSWDLGTLGGDDRSHLPAKSTLVLVPSALLMDVWVTQMEQHVEPGTLKVFKYHGCQRYLVTSHPLDYDVVISTYATVASDMSRGGGVLSQVTWYRLILDEAHVIRNWTTRQFEAVDSLSACIRWCITGTPIQNTVEDLGSLIKFLRVPVLANKAEFRKHVSGIRNPTLGYARPNISNLKKLLESLCLRRSRIILNLPGVDEIRYEPELSTAERLVYDGLKASCKTSINAAMSRSGSPGSAVRPVLEGILRLRMFCNVGMELGNKSGRGGISAPDQLLSLVHQGGETSCSRCGADIVVLDDADAAEQPRLSHCLKLVCGECAPTLLKRVRRSKNGRSDCPICNEHQDGGIFVDHQDVAEHNEHLSTAPEATSTRPWPSKLHSVVEDIIKHFHDDKSILFSFWRQSLDVVGHALEEKGISYYRVDGLLRTSQRKRTLRAFCHDGSVRVLLMTLGTGATGLNDLSVASRVHFLEPQWNPSIESQAIGRLLRLGQEKPVCIVRYITKGTIEKSVENRQITKIQLALAGGLHSDEKTAGEGRKARDKQLLELHRAIDLG